MSALGQISLKQADGSYKNLTVSISDTTNPYGQNISIYEEQTKEEREAKKPRNYVGNGKIFWTDGKVVKAERKEAQSVSQADDDLPF
jgi:hypothetical protein